MATNNNKCCPVLIGLQEMADYLGVSIPKVKDYMALGMPHGKIMGKMHFHTQLVDMWFRQQTSFSAIPDTLSPETFNEEPL